MDAIRARRTAAMRTPAGRASGARPARPGSRALLVLFLVTAVASAQSDGPVMRAHFLDMGQADATLLEFPCGAVLIDAGAQSADQVQRLTDHLQAFFARRPDLDETLDAVFVTHNHIDHTRALMEVVETFNVRNYVDNGLTDGRASPGPRRLRDHVAATGAPIVVREVRDDEIVALAEAGEFGGLTDGAIDPLACADCDPRIVVLSSSLAGNPGWSHHDFDNHNNHSLVIRVDFGEASFLFTGDLEEQAIETLVLWYEQGDSDALDVDVYQVGHHASANGTTANLMEAMSPSHAVISCGASSFGRGSGSNFTTFAYGHPRRSIVEMLEREIPGRRSTALMVDVADGARNFTRMRVSKRVYATAWDGTVRVRADLDGGLRVTRDGPGTAP